MVESEESVREYAIFPENIDDETATMALILADQTGVRPPLHVNEEIIVVRSNIRQGAGGRLVLWRAKDIPEESVQYAQRQLDEAVRIIREQGVTMDDIRQMMLGQKPYPRIVLDA